MTEAIALERKRLEPIRAVADVIIDTTDLNVNQLRERLHRPVHRPTAAERMQISVVSFGFKHGVPLDVDNVFDVRFLPNPHWIEELRPLTGPGRAGPQLRAVPAGGREFLARIDDLLGFLLPAYVKEGKAYLTVAVGCTGGRHRSVSLAEELAARIRSRGYDPAVYHRDLTRSIAPSREPATGTDPPGPPPPDRSTRARPLRGGPRRRPRPGHHPAGRAAATPAGSPPSSRWPTTAARAAGCARSPASPRPATCAAAWSPWPTPESPWAEAFEYRFPSGDLEGHALGNLIIAGLANVTGDFGRALDLAAGLLGGARAGPAGHRRCRSCSRPTWPAPRWWARSTCPSRPGPISSVSIVPPDAPAPAEVLAAVSEADQVVIGPGSLFTSVLAVCVVPEHPGRPGGPRPAAGSTSAISGPNCRRRPDSPPTTTCGRCSTTACRST